MLIAATPAVFHLYTDEKNYGRRRGQSVVFITLYPPLPLLLGGIAESDTLTRPILERHNRAAVGNRTRMSVLTWRQKWKFGGVLHSSADGPSAPRRRHVAYVAYKAR